MKNIVCATEEVVPPGKNAEHFFQSYGWLKIVFYTIFVVCDKEGYKKNYTTGIKFTFTVYTTTTKFYDTSLLKKHFLNNCVYYIFCYKNNYGLY